MKSQRRAPEHRLGELAAGTYGIRGLMTPAEIAATRRLLGLTVDQLGAELGINPRTIRAWEAGKYAPKDTAAQALRDLRSEHDEDLAALLPATGDTKIALPDAPRDRGWYVALGARIIDRHPTIQIDWQHPTEGEQR